MKFHFLPIALLLLLAGCDASAPKPTSEETAPTAPEPSYRQISQEEAARLMETEQGYRIVDVRRPDEFSEGHIPGAINVPNEDIGQEPPAALPDKAQLLLIYCRSGRRSKEAAQKLADIGYTNVVEFGGILTWTGEVVAD